MDNIHSKMALQNATMHAAQSKFDRACSEYNLEIDRAKAKKKKMLAEAREEFDAAKAALEALEKEASLKNAQAQMAQIWANLETGAASEMERAADEKLSYHTEAELAAAA